DGDDIGVRDDEYDHHDVANKHDDDDHGIDHDDHHGVHDDDAGDARHDATICSRDGHGRGRVVQPDQCQLDGLDRYRRLGPAGLQCLRLAEQHVDVPEA